MSTERLTPEAAVLAALVCSFCGKGSHAVKHLIAGAAVYICDECVRLAFEIVAPSDLVKCAWCLTGLGEVVDDAAERAKTHVQECAKSPHRAALAAAQAEAATLRARAEEAEAALRAPIGWWWTCPVCEYERRNLDGQTAAPSCSGVESGKPHNQHEMERTRAPDTTALRAQLATLQAERDAAMTVLAPSMPSSGLEDAARQVKQVAVTSLENSATLEAQLAEAAARIAALEGALGEAFAALDGLSDRLLARRDAQPHHEAKPRMAFEYAAGLVRELASGLRSQRLNEVKTSALLAPSPTAPRGTTELPAVQGTMCTVAECDNADAVLCCGECGVGRCAAHLDVPFDHGNKDCVPAAPKVPDAGAGREAVEWKRTACGVDEHVADPHRGLALFADEGSGKTLVVQIHVDGPGAMAEAERIARAAGFLPQQYVDESTNSRPPRGSDQAWASGTAPALPAQGAPVAAPASAPLVVCDDYPAVPHKSEDICLNPRPAPAEVAAPMCLSPSEHGVFACTLPPGHDGLHAFKPRDRRHHEWPTAPAPATPPKGHSGGGDAA